MWMGMIFLAMGLGGGAGIAILMAGQPFWLALLLYSLVGSLSLAVLGLVAALRPNTRRDEPRPASVTVRS